MDTYSVVGRATVGVTIDPKLYEVCDEEFDDGLEKILETVSERGSASWIRRCQGCWAEIFVEVDITGKAVLRDYDFFRDRGIFVTEWDEGYSEAACELLDGYDIIGCELVDVCFD